jgi:hypothetical protein
LRVRGPDYDVAVSARSAFLESPTDTDLYSMGAFFCDRHPDLVEESFGGLLTGLAVRYFKAVAG